jgi:hypothetical protein
MPTISEMKTLADELKIPYKASYTKDKMIKLLGEKRVKELDYAVDCADISSKKGYINKGKLYNTIATYKTDNLIIIVLCLEEFNNILIVKGTKSGKGLGFGGAKWVWTRSFIK